MKSKLSLDMARYRRYTEPFVLRVERGHIGSAQGGVASSGSVRVTEHRNEQTTLSTDGPGGDRRQAATIADRFGRRIAPRTLRNSK
jgi:hypothetical protein